MSEIDELQRRITAAMARIGAGLETLSVPQPGPDPTEMEALRAELEEERLANGQLAERLSALSARHKADLEILRKDEQALQAAVAQLDADLARLRLANEQLRASNAALRTANAEGLADTGLIHAGMTAELEALRSARAAEMSEAGAIMAQLAPLLAQVPHLPEGEDL